MGKQRKFTKSEWISVKWIKQNIAVSIIMLIATIGAISFFGDWVSRLNWKKATDEDWNHLYEQVEIIRGKQLEVADDTIMEIKLESDECILILKKDKDNQVVEILECDKATPIIGIIVGVPVMAVISVILWYVIAVLEIVVFSIVIGFWPKKLKQKGES